MFVPISISNAPLAAQQLIQTKIRISVVAIFAATLLACNGSITGGEGPGSSILSDLTLCSEGEHGRTGLRRISVPELVTTLNHVLELSDNPLSQGDVFKEAGGTEGFSNIAAAMPLSAEAFGSWASAIKAALENSSVLNNSVCDSWESCSVTYLEIAQRSLSKAISEESLTATELLFNSLLAEGATPKEALVECLRFFFLSPDFVFREMHEGSNLNATELMRRLSFLIWRMPPDESTKATFDSESNRTSDAIRPVIQAMFDDARGANFIEGFLDEWLNYSKIQSIDAIPLNPQYPDLSIEVREKMLQETKLFLGDLLRSGSSINEMLTATHSFMDAELATYYELETNAGAGFEKVSSDQRLSAGILSQGSILVSISGTRSTSPSRRGYWMLKNILCEEPAPFPDNLDPNLIQEQEASENLSTREALAMHASDPSCAGCHLRMDNVGLSIEAFGPDARFRINDEYGNVIDSSGTIEGVGSFGDHQELARLLASGPQFKQCIVRKALVFATGRDLNDNDRCIAEKITEKLDMNARFSDVIAEIVFSSSFAFEGAER